MIFDAHWYLVALAVIAYFGVGALWYSPLLFADSWMKALGKHRDEMASANSAMVVTLVAMIVIVVAEAYILQATGTNSMWLGGYLGAKLWLGFTAATALINNVFQNGNKKLFVIDQGYHLVGMVLAGIILAY